MKRTGQFYLLALALGLTLGQTLVMSEVALAGGKKRAQAEPRPAADGPYWFNAGWDTWFNRAADDVITPGNQVDLYVDGPEYYPLRLKMIKEATRTIDMQTYLWCDDVAGLHVAKELAAAARRGVRVRVIGDQFNIYPHDQSAKAMRDAGIPWLIYNPTYWGIYDVNKRVHEKVFIIDGREMLIGGANMCSEYLVHTPEKPLWHDLELHAKGPVVARAQARFDETWNWMAEQENTSRDGYDGVMGGAFHRTFTGQTMPIAERPTQVVDEIVGQDFALYVDQQPYWRPHHSQNNVKLYSELVKLAKKRVIVYQPYMVPNPDFEKALLDTARRGIEVKILTNSKETNDLATIPAAGAFGHYGRALAAGAEVWEITRQTLHAKAILIDDRILTVGSHNLTHRSFATNGEANLMTNSRSAIARFEKMVQYDLTHFRKLTPEMVRAGSDEDKERAMLIIGRWLERFF